MKILCEYTPAGPSFVRSGWGRVFAAAGHNFQFWDPSGKSAFDAFSEFEPDIFLGTTYGVDRSVYKNIASREQLKVGLFCSAWGSLVKDIDKKKYPIVIASDDEKRTVENLKKETGKPDFVFLHITDQYLDGTIGGWKEIGVKPVGILNAADIYQYSLGRVREELRSDWVFCGGFWPYKATNLIPYLFPLLDLKCKIVGNGIWPVPQYLGFIDEVDVKDLFASAIVCPNVSEPHSTDLGWDCIERLFKTLSSGGFCVSDHVDELRNIFREDEIPTGKNAKEFDELVRHFVRYPEETAPYKEKGRNKVVNFHTYHHRVAKMLENFDLHEEAQRILAIHKKLTQESI